MRLAYADPPYPGKAHLYPEAAEVDHGKLISDLREYDGWALSTDERNLQYVLSLCPEGVRVLAWCKPDAVPFNGPWASWEPVICKPARTAVAQVRSYHVVNAPPRGFAGKSFTGSKPPGFCEWIIRCLGAVADEDTLADLFPGTGAMTEEWERFLQQPSLLPPPALSHSGTIQSLRRHHPQIPGMAAGSTREPRNQPEENVL